MTIKKGLLIGFSLLVNLLTARCSTQIAGVETTNGCTVVATAGAIEGIAPPLSRAFLCNAGYIPYIDSGIGIGTAADGKGAFQFSAPPGNYTIFIIGPTGEAAGIAITSPDSAGAGAVSKQQQLLYPGAVSGTVSNTTPDTLLVFLAGMCHYQVVFTTAAFYLQNVPEGTYILKIARLPGALTARSLEILHEQPVTVFQDEITAVGDVGF